LLAQVNLHEDLQVEYHYSEETNPDLLFYGANIYYNFDVVNVIKFDYKKVHFQIRYYFDAFDAAISNRIVFYGLVFNPKYSVPSTSNLKFTVNIPPRNCEIFVTPETGIELSQIFSIKVKNCVHPINSFLYKFGFYTSQEALQEDILLG
jgi:hypothetical protein